MKRLTAEEFIQKATLVHGGKFNYSKVYYIKNSSKVIIICPTHGEFLQNPSDHLSGNGCLRCSNTKSTEDFIAKSIVVHGDKYNYEFSEFLGHKVLVRIECKIHGVFLQSPVKHLQGRGCPKCAGKNMQQNDWIEEFNRKHSGRYDYSKVEYIDHKTKIEIICRVHGSFWQTPNAHNSKLSGCPKCNTSKGENRIEKYLIDNNIRFENQYRFDGCRDKRPLPFDFYLKDYNIAIEFDGEQHFIIGRWSKEEYKNIERFENLKRRDKIKDEYCLKNNIRLLRMPYMEENRIEEILDLIFGDS